MERAGIKILSNFNKLGINSENNLVISHNEIKRMYDNSFTLYKNSRTVITFAEKNKNKFNFSEGSEIITDSRGMLTFRSSNKDIQEFYISSCDHGFLAIATEHEFAGSEYYLPKDSLMKMRTMEEMYNEFLKPFIEHILDYGA